MNATKSAGGDVLDRVKIEVFGSVLGRRETRLIREMKRLRNAKEPGTLASRGSEQLLLIK